MSSQYYSATAYVGTPHRNEVEVTIPLVGPAGPQGPAGEGGGGDLTSPGPIGSVAPNTGAFTTLSATGTATLPHIHGSLAGNLYIHVKNTSGGQLTRGTPVYIVGNVGDTDRVEVAAADFDDATKMPAVGLLEQTLANNGSGDAIILGELDEANTNAYTINTELYVGNNGALTSTRPTTGQVQSVGVVARVNSNTGVIVVNMQGQRSPNEAFAAASHAHAASAITSGVLDNARVNFAAPAAIGNTTPAAGNFTSVRVDPKTGSVGSLVVGSTTSSETNFIVLDLDGIKLRAPGSPEVATIAIPTTLSDDRSYQLPNASGTLALTSSLTDTQIFTANGTWTKPAGAKIVHYLLIGGGGGGGAGRRSLPSNSLGGGGGGAGGGITAGYVDPAFLGSTETITIGAGGTGAVDSADNTNGAAGTAGGESNFGSFIKARGGSAGGGGSSSGGGAGAATTLASLFYGTNASTAAGANGAASSTPPSNAAASVYLPTGGGGGGGRGSNTNGVGSKGGDIGQTNTGITSAPAIAAGTNGPAGIRSQSSWAGTGGGGGSMSSDNAVHTGFSGGNGGLYGGGGGGGSGAANSAGGSTAGGTGGNGIVIVTTYF
jgi:hypothetical protein